MECHVSVHPRPIAHFAEFGQSWLAQHAFSMAVNSDHPFSSRLSRTCDSWLPGKGWTESGKVYTGLTGEKKNGITRQEGPSSKEKNEKYNSAQLVN